MPAEIITNVTHPVNKTKTYKVYTLAGLNTSVMKNNPEAFVATPTLIHLENPLNVPPPPWNVAGE